MNISAALETSNFVFMLLREKSKRVKGCENKTLTAVKITRKISIQRRLFEQKLILISTSVSQYFSQ
jgi:hypothetical protein